MAACTPQGSHFLNGVKRLTKFNNGLGLQLPDAYKKFWKEWKQTPQTAVHHILKEGSWEIEKFSGIVRPIQNIAIPVIYPKEHNIGIWGGEGIVKGFQKRNPLKRRVPHFWVPVLKRSVVKSEILNEYMSVTVTERTINMIHESNGFDHYLLKTPACDLRSVLALNIKRKILKQLEAGCPELSSEPAKQSLILKEFKKYLDQYTSEEIDWYGLTYGEAVLKLRKEIKNDCLLVPHKLNFRKQLIEHLKDVSLNKELKDDIKTNEITTKLLKPFSWFSKKDDI